MSEIIPMIRPINPKEFEQILALIAREPDEYDDGPYNFSSEGDTSITFVTISRINGQLFVTPDRMLTTKVADPAPTAEEALGIGKDE